MDKDGEAYWNALREDKYWPELHQEAVRQGYTVTTSPESRAVLSTLLEQMQDQLVSIELMRWRKEAESTRLQRRAERELACSRFTVWNEASDALGFLLDVSIRYLHDVAHRNQRHPGFGIMPLSDVLLRLYSWGILLGEEILFLLHYGFASGAQARWRTLYECVVVARFLLKKGNDIAKRYEHHLHAQHLELIEKLAPEKSHPDADKHAKLLADRERVFGDWSGPGPLWDMEEDYGWAAWPKKRRVKFGDLQRIGAPPRLRPFYSIASQAIHAGPWALYANSLDVHVDPAKLLPAPLATDIERVYRSTIICLVWHMQTLLLHWPMPFDGITCAAIQKLAAHTLQQVKQAAAQAERK